MRHTIAIVTPAFTPAEAFGGPVTSIANLTKLLCKKGFNVKVYTTDILDPHRPRSNSMLPRTEYIDGVTVKRYRPVFCIFGYWVTPTIFKDLLTDQFDIINAHSVRSFQFDIAALVSRIRNIKLVANPHGSLYSYGVISARTRRLLFNVHNAILKLAFRQASRIIASSSEENAQFTRFGVGPDKIFALPNFLDETQFSVLPPRGEFRKRFGIGSDEKMILFLGRLDRVKGLDILVKAYSKLFEARCNTWLVIAGPDNGFLGTIQKLLKELNFASRVIMPGPLYGAPKYQALVDSDFVVLPSRYESFGISVIEANLCGKPVLASNVGGLRDLVIEGKTGFLFKVGDVDELACRLEELLDRSEDLEQIGKSARKFALSRYSAYANGDSLVSIYSHAK